MTAHIVLFVIAVLLLAVQLWQIFRRGNRTIGYYCAAAGMVLVILGQTVQLL